MSTWPQCTLAYDGTFSGFLTCVGDSFRRKEYPFYFLTPGNRQFSLYPLREIITDPHLARQVYQDLETEVSESFRRMMTCILISQEAGQVVGLVFPSLSEFSTVYCDPHSQRLWHSQ